MKWILLIAISFFVTAHAEEEITNKDCVDEIRKAKVDVENEAERLQRLLADAPPLSTSSANRFLSTGDPMTDMINTTVATNQQIAKVEQETSSQIANVEDNCFSQNQQMDDQLHAFRQTAYKRQQILAQASTEKMKQEATVRTECANEATENFNKELARLQGYRERTVSTIGGVTGSEREIMRLEDRFYARCMARKATREALESIKNNFDMQLRNLKTETEAILSDMDYLDSKRSRLGEHCSLRVERVLEQNRINQNSLRQAAQLQSMALQMSMMTSNASMEGQGQAAGRFMSVNDVLSPAGWKNISESCCNLDANTKPFEVPADIFDLFRDVNETCSKASGVNTNCIRSTRSLSSEGQRINNGNRQTNQ